MGIRDCPICILAPIGSLRIRLWQRQGRGDGYEVLGERFDQEWERG